MTRFRGAIVDVDGTLVRGETVLPGAAEGLRALREAGIDVLLFSNNPTRPASYYRRRLEDCGLDVDDADALTAMEVCAEYLADEHPDDAHFVVGEENLREGLRARELRLTADPDRAEVVVSSIDRTFDYDRLTEALYAVEAADAFVATDPDRTIPSGDRPVPGSGAITAAIAGVADRDPDVVAGKPSPIAIAAAFGRLGVDPEACLVVGDRLDTDVALGERAGATTALVATGIADPGAIVDGEVEPDYVIDSLADVRDLLA